MSQTDTLPNGAGEQLHRNDSSLSDQKDKYHQNAEETSEEMFNCSYGNHQFARRDAFYPGKKTPAICRNCTLEKRRQNHKRDEEARAKKLASIDEIPRSGERGESKRSTFTLSQYATTAIDVLAVGSSGSEIVERAIIHLLQSEDPQVIAFVGRMFQPARKK